MKSFCLNNLSHVWRNLKHPIGINPILISRNSIVLRQPINIWILLNIHDWMMGMVSELITKSSKVMMIENY